MGFRNALYNRTPISSTSHVPPGTQLVGQLVPRATELLRDTRDPVRARAQALQLHGRDAAAVAADAAGVAGVAAITEAAVPAEARWRGEVEGCEGAGFAKCVTEELLVSVFNLERDDKLDKERRKRLTGWA